MNSFIIGDIEFGIGSFEYSVKDKVLNLEIYADEDRFDELCEDDDFKFGWALDTPQMYFTDVPVDGADVMVDEDLLEQCDIALYMMEHNDFYGKVLISDKVICIEGEVDLMGEVHDLSIRLEINS